VLPSSFITTLSKLQVEFTHKLKDPNEDDGVSEEDDSVYYSSWNDDGEVVSSNPFSTFIKKQLIKVNKVEVVDKIPAMNNGVSASHDDLFDSA
jgi:hypothetical protein